MKTIAKKDFKYSPNGFTILAVKKGEALDLKDPEQEKSLIGLDLIQPATKEPQGDKKEVSDKVTKDYEARAKEAGTFKAPKKENTKKVEKTDELELS